MAPGRVERRMNIQAPEDGDRGDGSGRWRAWWRVGTAGLLALACTAVATLTVPVAGRVRRGDSDADGAGSRLASREASEAPAPGRALFGALTQGQMQQWMGQAQGAGGRGGRTRTGGGGNLNTQFRGDPRRGVPEWNLDEGFHEDAFSFVRLQYRSAGRGGWRVDYPGADLNLSYRLHRLSSMRVSPEPLAITLDDPRLFEYPFLFMTDPRSIALSAAEVEIFRRYLLGGGFVLVDDFWGKKMWDHLTSEMAKVFPDREPVSLPLEHTIFHQPYHLPYKPQVPSEDSAHATKDQPDPYRTWEYEIDEEPRPVEYRAYLDDKGRVMMLIGWNTDLSDGWEEEGISEWFFKEYSEKLAYPMGINIVFYAMTH